MKGFLHKWASKHQVSHIALADLLQGLKMRGHPKLSSTAGNLFQTPTNIPVNMKSGMQHVHFDFRETLMQKLQQYPREMLQKVGEIEVSLNVDGLPVFKSTKLLM